MMYEQEKQTILKHCKDLVPFDGWTETMLGHAAQEAGYPPEMALVFFKQGVKEALEFYLQQADLELETAVGTIADFETLSIRRKIFTLVQLRLQQHQEHKPLVRKTLQTLSLPRYQLLSASSLWQTADCMWHLAGDRSTDLNHYSKRTLLSGVYLSTVFFWLDDTSENYQESWLFLERRIDNVLSFGSCMQSVKKNIPFLSNIMP